MLKTFPRLPRNIRINSTYLNFIDCKSSLALICAYISRSFSSHTPDILAFLKFFTHFKLISVVSCQVLTVASQPAYRFLKREVSCYSHLFKNFPHVAVIYTVKGFIIVNQAVVDVFLELSCFVDDPTNVGNLISGSSAFSKSSLNIWKFSVHILLKPHVENFEHYFASM